MKEFLQLLRRFVPPYKKYLVWALFLNLLSAFLNIFSFSLIIPILQILFKMDTKVYEFVAWDTAGVGLKDIVVNNFYYGVSQLIAEQGASLTLLILGVFQLGISYILYVESSKYCPPLACCLLGAAEPLLNPVWVLIFDGERPGVFALIGGVIVVASITVWCIFGQE